MIKIRLLFAGLMIVVLGMLVACGGDDDDGATDPDAENALAEELLLTVDDFPGEGWTEEPEDEDDEAPNPLDECDPGPAEGRTGEAETGDFTNTDFTNTDIRVSESVGVFDTAEHVVASLDRVQMEGDCRVAIVNDGGLDDDQATYGDATFEEVDAPSVGDVARAFRLEIAGDPEAAAEESAILYFDFVFVTEGRFGMGVRIFQLFEPADESLLQEVTEAAHAKLAAVEQ